MKNRNGSVLVVTVWGLAVLSLVAIGAGYQAGIQLKMVARSWDEARERQLIQAALLTARASLPEGVAAPMGWKDRWSSDEGLFHDKRFPDGLFSLEHTVPELSKERILYGMEDESSRIALNTASVEILTRLLGEDNAAVAQSIVEWRQAAPDPERRKEVREYYLARPNPYPCKEAPFESVEELMLVAGMTPALYKRLAPYVTVYTAGTVNMNTAPVAVLSALGLEQGLIDKISSYRLGSDGEAGTEDDQLFTNEGSLIPDLEKDVSLSSDERTQLARIRPLITVRTRHFRLHLRSRPGSQANEGQRPLRAQIIVEMNGIKAPWIIKRVSHNF